jgi:GAF domain-containing protein
MEQAFSGSRDVDTPHPIAAPELLEALHTGGLMGALGCLNARIRYRFTGLYRADPPLLHNVVLFDRENPRLEGGGTISQLDDTYCAITCTTGSSFHTADAARDPRLVRHAKRDTILCYAGVPIRLANGQVWGSLCHFDLRPRLLPRGELAVLVAAAPIVAAWLAEHHR